MTRESTEAERAATKLRVVGSLQADNGKDTHRGTYAIRPPLLKPCPRCGYPEGSVLCPVCHKQAA